MLGLVYLIDSILLLGATFLLIKTLDKEFSKSALKNETLILKVIFVAFTIGYVGQAALYLIVGVLNSKYDSQPKIKYNITNTNYIIMMILEIVSILS